MVDILLKIMFSDSNNILVTYVTLICWIKIYTDPLNRGKEEIVMNTFSAKDCRNTVLSLIVGIMTHIKYKYFSS